MSFFQLCLLTFRKIAFISVLLILVSCAGISGNGDVSVKKPELIPIVVYKAFGDKPLIVSANGIFQLSPVQERKFRRYIGKQDTRKVSRNQLVYNYLKESIQGFNYHSDTLTATDAARDNRGNCLSLAILTSAYARIADIEIGYELMQTPPVYQKQGNTVLTSQHIRSLLYRPKISDHIGINYYYRSVIKVDYFPTDRARVKRSVDTAEFISMFYQNKAAEQIVEKNYKLAFWYIKESLKYAEDNHHAINMLALVYSAMGHESDAERFYRHGIEFSDEKLELLSNYHSYLIKHHRINEASEIKQEIEKINEPNPFDWLSIADKALFQGELSEASYYYKKVIKLAPYLHQGHAGLGKVEFLRGNPGKAGRAFKKARELAFDTDVQRLYDAKRFALAAYVNKNK